MKDRKQVPTRKQMGANVTLSQAQSAKTSAPVAFTGQIYQFGSSSLASSLTERTEVIYTKNMDYMFFVVV